MNSLPTIPNPDLIPVEDNFARWASPNARRHGWHNLHLLTRYSATFRAAEVLPLHKRIDASIAGSDRVARHTALPWFSAMAVVRDSELLFEKYASDFGPDRPHSMQSITKTLNNLIIGALVENGMLDLDRRVDHYIPEIGTGYAAATVQQVLNMDVTNDYSEDFTDPRASYFDHEAAVGWRVTPGAEPGDEREFLQTICSDDVTNDSGLGDYKDANAALLGWIAERVSGRPLREHVADIVDAAGIEGVAHITTDRRGTPTLAGGLCLTARDAARYFSLFARRGRGASGQQVGGAGFIEMTLRNGLPMPAGALETLRYSNHVLRRDRSIVGAGWGGEMAVANLDTGIVAVLFSVLENRYGDIDDYLGSVVDLLLDVTAGVITNDYGVGVLPTGPVS